MHRPPARRPRSLAGALTALVAAGGCADDGPAVASRPAVVAVAAQPCDRPLPSEGLGVVVSDGLVVTAGHVVDGDRRTVTVNGAPASVVGLDARTDLAFLSADVSGAAELVDVASGATRIATPGGDVAAAVIRTGTLIVYDATDRARYVRQVHTIDAAVPPGTSGAPLVDEAGNVLGIVVLANRTDGTSYAVTSAEVRPLLGRERRRDAGTGCPE